MWKKELNRRTIIKVVLESRKLVKEVRDAVDPVSQARSSLEGASTFLERMHQEVTKEVASHIGKTLVSKLADGCHTMLLMPVKELFRELWAQAVVVMSKFLRRN